jgi:hypothetical protein
MTEQEIKEAIDKLPIAKRREIAELFCTVGMSLNSIECLLINTPLDDWDMLDQDDSPTLWCHVFKLEKLFKHL